MDISTVSKDEIRETYFKTVSKNKVIVFLATNNFSTLTRTINNNKNNHIQTIEEYMEVLNLDNWLDIEKLNPITNEFFVIEFNSEEDLNKITAKTAAVVLETIQGGAGFIIPESNYIILSIRILYF